MKPLLEIRVSQDLTREQAERLTAQANNTLGELYNVILLDTGMSAHLQDEAILNELREIKELIKAQTPKVTGTMLEQIFNKTTNPI